MEESNVVRIRPFKFPKHRTINSEFIGSRLPQNTEFMIQDLAASGLTPEDVHALVQGDLALPADSTAGYVLGYTHPDGNWLVGDDNTIIMYRMKLKYPANILNKNKYVQPSGEELLQHDLTAAPPYIPKSYHDNPKTEILAICEGEKKAACVAKYIGISTIGLGGCWTWRSKETLGHTHPWIVQIVRNHKKVVVVPDGDLRRYDICKAYGTFINELLRELKGWDGEITILEPPGKIDDLIVEWGPEALSNWDALPKVLLEELVEDKGTLALRYDLSYDTDAKGRVKVHQNSSNITRLLERHPAFPKMWLNTDNSTTMIGDDPIRPESTELLVCNHLQHNLGMSTIRHQLVRDVLKSLSIKNERSPFLDQINSLAWDGRPRLDTWMIRLWDVEDTEYTRAVSARFLMSAVARLREPGCKLDWMLITTGGQGTGKSSMPQILFPDLVTNVLGTLTDKDVQMAMHSGLCIVIDEMDALNKGQIEFWKSAITTQEDRFRPPYGAAVVMLKRRSVLYGTSNSATFLNMDNTGYRRYRPVQVNELLDFEGLKAERWQLWAEAAHRQHLGEQYWEVEADPAYLEQYVAENPIYERLTNTLRAMMSDPRHMCYFMVNEQRVFDVQTTEIMDAMGLEVTTSPKVNRDLQDMVVKLGAKKCRSKVRQSRQVYRFTQQSINRLISPES